MYILFVQVDVKPEHRDAWLPAIRAHADRSLKNDPATLRFDLIEDDTDPNRFYFYEAYKDRAAFDAHAKGASMPIYRAATQGMTNATSVVRGSSFFPPDAE